MSSKAAKAKVLRNAQPTPNQLEVVPIGLLPGLRLPIQVVFETDDGELRKLLIRRADMPVQRQVRLKIMARKPNLFSKDDPDWQLIDGTETPDLAQELFSHVNTESE